MSDDAIAIAINLLIFGGALIGVVYYAVQRLKAKKTEDFEKRDN